jgi:hypothetical protein
MSMTRIPYNLTKGPDGDLYIADAGANSIIHRKGPGNYMVLAEVPGIANPYPFGAPVVESVQPALCTTGATFGNHAFRLSFPHRVCACL